MKPINSDYHFYSNWIHEANTFVFVDYRSRGTSSNPCEVIINDDIKSGKFLWITIKILTSDKLFFLLDFWTNYNGHFTYLKNRMDLYNEEVSSVLKNYITEYIQSSVI